MAASYSPEGNIYLTPFGLALSRPARARVIDCSIVALPLPLISRKSIELVEATAPKALYAEWFKRATLASLFVRSTPGAITKPSTGHLLAAEQGVSLNAKMHAGA